MVELAASGEGSVQFVRDLVSILNNDGIQTSSTATDLAWCQCGVCQNMPTEDERKCCERKKCLTSYQKFKKICLDKDILEVCIKSTADFYAEEFDFSANSYRKAAYRQYILWKFGKLGYHNRRVIPECVVRMIRAAYPSPDGIYMGFKWH